MKTEEKSEKINRILGIISAVIGIVGSIFGIFQAQQAATLKKRGEQSSDRITTDNCKCCFHLRG